ncbi:MAG: glycosyltransferase family 2 protein, partial [Anaerolineae bacterium]|nr:glycosyltransferase family 2 protein [Anaerolineae bacterium]
MKPAAPEPLVTVIMPIRNEEAFIARSLGAVLQQDYPAERIEVLIADGMSDDDTLAVIRSLPGAERVRVIANPDRLQAPGMNRAIQEARGEIIIRVDGHTVIAPDYVRQCVRALTETGADNVGGAMDPVGVTPMGKAIAAAGKSPFAVPTAFHVSQTAQFTDTVYMGAWRRDVFERVGLYDETFKINEDYELNYRIRKAGGKIYFTPDIRSQYFGRQTLDALARQYFRYGVGKTRTLRAHPASIKPRQLVAPLFVLGLVAGALLSLLSPVFTLLWLAGIALYGVVNAVFSLRAAPPGEPGTLLRIP